MVQIYIFPVIVSGAVVGFVCVSSFLSMFVELGVQTSLTIHDTRWVGNWWLGFAIFGAICVFWSIWLVGFPKQIPLIKKEREKELFESLTTAKLVQVTLLVRVTNLAEFSKLIRFNAQGAYLPLVPQGRAIIRDRALLFFWGSNRMFKTKPEDEIVRLKELCTHMDIMVEKLIRRPPLL